MITCPSCFHKELSGALFCSKCGAQLVRSADENATGNFPSAVIDHITQDTVSPFPPISPEENDSHVALLILRDGSVIHVRGNDEFILGRSTKGQTIIPDIDFSPYQAYEEGVSRLHANINIAGSIITIKDLGSANGTRLNGNRIKPHDEYPLHHGDILTFGKLKVQVLIKE